MSLYYLDTSAALKLLTKEEHSKAFAKFYDKNTNASWVSSVLLRIEVMRTVTRVMPAASRDARDLLSAFDYLDIDDVIVDGAMNEPDRMLRSLDAIHLASARVLGNDLTALITYDARLATAADSSGLKVLCPQD